VALVAVSRKARHATGREVVKITSASNIDNNMIVLGIETSCDETALSIIEIDGDENSPSMKILGNVVHSQIDIHQKYGGVFPALAKREHARNLIPLFEKILKESGLISNSQFLISNELGINKILEREPELLKLFKEFIPKIEKPPVDLISVTYGPGLEPALWVGINFAKALGEVWNIPIIGANHMEGHIVSALINTESGIRNQELRRILFPAVALLISGGHTEIVEIESWQKYRILGRTKDDAVGEAFDKVARILGLPYPGGPEISRLAEKVRNSHNSSKFKLPRPMIHTEDFDFSFSGLKTAVLYTVKKIPEMTESIKEEIAFEFENAATDVLISKTQKAIENVGAKTLILGGGVIANSHIRKSFESLAERYPDLNLLTASREVSTDNALMIALAGYFNFISSKKLTTISEIIAKGNLSL
jgi:N6-L-threonylcarbamoyladenine synthase